MDSISKSIFSGTVFTAVAKYSNVVIQLIVTAILARFVDPADFGVIAVASVFINLFYLLGDLGISTAIIQRKDITRADLDEYFTFSLYLSIGLSAFFLLASPVIASYYESSVLKIILFLLTGQILFSTINMVPNALLLKNQEFRFIAIRTIIVQTLLGTIACVAAIMGAGIYSLLINPIIGIAVIFFFNFFHVERLKLTFRIHKESIKKIFSYSAYQFLFSIQNYVYRNIDKLLIGKFLNMEQLGYYEKSYRLMTMPIQNISTVITPVLQPILSNYQHELSIQKIYFAKVTKLLAVIGLPLSAFLAFCSRELILIVFGEQWAEAILPFKILAFSVAPQMLGSVIGSIYQSTNNVKAQLYIGLINTVWSVSLMLFGLIYFRTTTGVALMFTIALLVEMVYNWSFVYKYVFRERIVDFFLLINKPFVIAIILSVVLYFFDSWTESLNILLSFFIKTILSLILVGTCLHIFKVYDIKQLLLNIKANILLWIKKDS